MKTAKLENMIRGWFIGNFEPAAYKTKECEVAVKYYKTGDRENAHYHKRATEITVIVSGIVRMNGTTYHPGDIVIEEPGDITDFEALTDAVNVVVKCPGADHDKYIVEGVCSI